MINNSFFGILFLIILSASCRWKNKKDVSVQPEQIYLDYKVWSEEGSDSVSVLVRFKKFVAHGAAISIEDLGEIKLDGMLLKADSTPMSGIFYAANYPLAPFIGDHSFELIISEKKSLAETFRFRTFRVGQDFSDTIQNNKDVEIRLPGLNDGDRVRILLTDTSFTGTGINRIDTVKNGRISISQVELSELAPGPINMELILEQEKVIENAIIAGGFLGVYYTIRKELWLK
ncbi:MAG: hypothetical protein N2747_06565 [Chitinophagaceae bacterium]|nr:hypothetical protein [Chitinophagaceae bacterium]